MDINNSAVITSMIGTLKEKSVAATSCDSETLDKIVDSIKGISHDFRGPDGATVFDVFQSALTNKNISKETFKQLLDITIHTGTFPSLNVNGGAILKTIKIHKDVCFAQFADAKYNGSWGYYIKGTSTLVSLLASLSQQDKVFEDEMKDEIFKKVTKFSNHDLLLVSKNGSKGREILSESFLCYIFRDKNGSMNNDVLSSLAKEEISKRKEALKRNNVELSKKYNSKKKEITANLAKANISHDAVLLHEIKDKLKRLMNSRLLSNEDLETINQELMSISNKLESVSNHIKNMVKTNHGIDS